MKLVAAIPLGTYHYQNKKSLARTTAKLLDDLWIQKPDRTLLRRTFLLCTELRMPDILLSPLLKCTDLELDKKTRRALNEALIYNQTSSRLKTYWLDMVSARYVDTGIEGIIMMPESAAKRGQPALKSFARAIALIPETWKRGGRKRLRKYLDRLMSAFPSCAYHDQNGLQLTPKYREQLKEYAAKYRWSDWKKAALLTY